MTREKYEKILNDEIDVSELSFKELFDFMIFNDEELNNLKQEKVDLINNIIYEVENSNDGSK